jgi:hypothetical protein
MHSSDQFRDYAREALLWAWRSKDAAQRRVLIDLALCFEHAAVTAETLRPANEARSVYNVALTH